MIKEKGMTSNTYKNPKDFCAQKTNKFSSGFESKGLEIETTSEISLKYLQKNNPIDISKKQWISKENYDKREDRIRMLIMKLKIDATNEIDDPRYILMVLNQIENEMEKK